MRSQFCSHRNGHDRHLPFDIDPGIVLRLDPDVLEKAGGRFTSEATKRVDGKHWFVCISLIENWTGWLPLFSKPGAHREQLTQIGRTGHPWFLKASFYWHPEQIWFASRESVVTSAAAAGDTSRRGSRNWVNTANLPEAVLLKTERHLRLLV